MFPYIYFNSIKVRLRLLINDAGTGLALFQFHKGSIKTEMMTASDVPNPLFQFHKGSIKTLYAFA